MTSIGRVIDWFAGSGNYMTLKHCMGGDNFWIGLTVTLDFAVAAGYGLIAIHWWRNQKLLQNVNARRALGRMRDIFFFCGICGYLFIPIKMVWPAWRLYDMFLAVLVYVTWRYAWGAKELKVVYTELVKTDKLEADLKHSQEELEASRHESRRRSFFMNAISHDLRTPLNGLVLQTDVAELSADANDLAGLRESLSEIKASARATADLLNMFLEVGRLNWSAVPNNCVDISVAEVVRRVVDVHHAFCQKKGLTIESDVPESLVLHTDRVKLERILGNLVDNGIKFTNQGGLVISVERSKDRIVFRVEDSGIGIEPKFQGRLFEEFFQVHNDERDRSKGFGLGLPIAKGLATQLDGTIAVESRAGAGSVFTLSLPGLSERRVPVVSLGTGSIRADQAAVAGG